MTEVRDLLQCVVRDELGKADQGQIADEAEEEDIALGRIHDLE